MCSFHSTLYTKRFLTSDGSQRNGITMIYESIQDRMSFACMTACYTFYSNATSVNQSVISFHIRSRRLNFVCVEGGVVCIAISIRSA